MPDPILYITGLALVAETLNALRVPATLAQYLNYNTVENPLLAHQNTTGVFLVALAFWVKFLKDDIVNAGHFRHLKAAVAINKKGFHFVIAVFAN